MTTFAPMKGKAKTGKTKKELLAELDHEASKHSLKGGCYEGRWTTDWHKVKSIPDWLIETALHDGELDYQEAEEIAETEWGKMKHHLEKQHHDFWTMGQNRRIDCITKIVENMIFKYEVTLPGEIIVKIVDDKLEELLVPF